MWNKQIGKCNICSWNRKLPFKTSQNLYGQFISYPRIRNSKNLIYIGILFKFYLVLCTEYARAPRGVDAGDPKPLYSYPISLLFDIRFKNYNFKHNSFTNFVSVALARTYDKHFLFIIHNVLVWSSNT